MDDYDSIYLIPKSISCINHRGNVKLESNFHNLYPIMSSPMAGISGSELVIEMGKNNCLGILHRFKVYIDRQADIRKVYKADVPFGVAIGLSGQWEIDLAKYAIDHGAILITVDIANGYLSNLKEYGEQLRKELGDDISIMCGNIITKEAAIHLLDCGFNWARIGIGPGSNCLTRRVTGVSRNQLAAIKECSEINIGIVADGGIKQSGDIVHSFYAGADFAMLGGMIANTFEAENTGKIFGMASEKNHINNGKEIKSIEGKETELDIAQRQPLEKILNQILWGIRSACTYLNCESYKEIPHKAKAVPINENII